MPGEEE